jgi:hypothetical protein
MFVGPTLNGPTLSELVFPLYELSLCGGTRARRVRNATERTYPIVTFAPPRKKNPHGGNSTSSANFVCLFASNGFAEFTNPSQKEIPQPGKRAQEWDCDTRYLGPASPSQNVALGCGQLSLYTTVVVRSRQFDGIACHFC